MKSKKLLGLPIIRFLRQLKTAKLVGFIEGLHEFITESPQFRKCTKDYSEARIQAEIRPLIIRYLEEYFAGEGFVDPIAKANKSFYWEGQEGRYGKERPTTFGSRNYPDFIITDPYLIAIEYKQSPNGSTVKQGVGQSVMHTLAGEFDFVYYLFQDESKGEQIKNSAGNEAEAFILDTLRDRFNVFIYFV